MARSLCLPALLVLASSLLGDPPPTRDEAVRRTREAIEAERAAYGGTWEGWQAHVRPWREDARRIMTTEAWPWPATRDFRFLGRALQFALLDDVGDQGRGKSPLDSIRHFDRQLKARGIDLVVMPIPSKIEIYPDYLSEKAPEDRAVYLAGKRLLYALASSDVEVLDLYTLFRDARKAHGDDAPLYYDRDSHWRNLGARLAAEAIGERLKRYEFVRKALAKGAPYATKPHERTDGAKADSVEIVVHRATEETYDSVGDSPVILTGDSFSMYNMHLGGHLPAQVARHIGMPLTYRCSEGLGPTVPVEIARAEREKGYLEGRRVLVWTFTDRGLKLREKDRPWPTAVLPSRSGDAPLVRDVEATGTVVAASPPPPENPPYDAFARKLHLKDLTDANGKPVGTGEGVVRVLALKDRKPLPIAAVKAGDRLTLRLTSWSEVADRFDKIMSGVLEDAQLEAEADHYWGEIAK